MFILWLAILIYGIIKKVYSCVPLCAAASIYCFADLIRDNPGLAGTDLSYVFSILELVLMLLMLPAAIWLCRKLLKNGKKFYLPVYLCAAAIAVKITRRGYFTIQSQRITQLSTDGIQIYEKLEFVCNVLDGIHTVLLAGMLVVIFILIRNPSAPQNGECG